MSTRFQVLNGASAFQPIGLMEVLSAPSTSPAEPSKHCRLRDRIFRHRFNQQQLQTLFLFESSLPAGPPQKWKPLCFKHKQKIINPNKQLAINRLEVRPTAKLIPPKRKCYFSTNNSKLKFDGWIVDRSLLLWAVLGRTISGRRVLAIGRVERCRILFLL